MNPLTPEEEEKLVNFALDNRYLIEQVSKLLGVDNYDLWRIGQEAHRAMRSEDDE